MAVEPNILEWNFAVKTDPATGDWRGIKNKQKSEYITLRAPSGYKIAQKTFQVEYHSQIGQDNVCKIASTEMDSDEDVVAVTLEAHAKSSGGLGTRGSTTGVARIGYRPKVGYETLVITLFWR